MKLMSQFKIYLGHVNVSTMILSPKKYTSGDKIQQRKILDLCIEFRDIFRNELDDKPAAIPPFRLVVNNLKCKVTSNCNPPRPQFLAVNSLANLLAITNPSHGNLRSIIVWCLIPHNTH
jgi:hypothetical protein